MQLTRQEINKNRAISASVTLLIFFLFILFLILFKLITPNPPFQEVGGGGGQEFALGMMNVGSEEIDMSDMGQVTDVVAEAASTKEEIVTAEEGENVDIKESKPEIKNEKMVVTPVKPKEEVLPEKTEPSILKTYKKVIGKKPGGEAGSTDQSGIEGREDGKPGANGQGGVGTGTNTGIGDQDGPDKGPGPKGFGESKYGIDLKGRAIVQPPKLPTDTKEQGKVVVDITVDSEGNVIEASPNGRGTTTSSALLKAKARQAALATKFNVDGKFPEQKGTITIIFSY